MTDQTFNTVNKAVFDKITYLVGNTEIIGLMVNAPSKKPFAEDVMTFLSDVSKVLMEDVRSRQYSEIVTFAFWIREASLKQIKEQHDFLDGNIHLGRGVVFHIAPANVPVNFVYSLVSGLLTGNANIVRVPSKEFPQIKIIIDAINRVLEHNEAMKPYVVFVRYGKDKEINGLLSSIADTRIIWGGNNTIADLRKSHLPPRSTEITFADRYSLAVIDSDVYMDMDGKGHVAQDFYNDTYFSDQNACTSPGIVIWTGDKKKEAKEIFWKLLHDLVEKKYNYQDIQGVNKLISSYLAAVSVEGAKIIPHEDNLVVRVQVESVTNRLIDIMDNSGYFFEYDCTDVMELKEICDDKRCQTIGLIGEKEWFMPLVKSGIKGVDRIVPIGKTMDFSLIWDGYDLMSSLTRTIMIVRG